MSIKRKARSYKAASLETASPGKIILMLFDGILRFIDTARDGFQLEPGTLRNEVISNNIIKAQRIVSELQANLDMTVPGELPGTLYRLYDYMFAQLNEANLKKTTAPLDTIEPMVRELRDAWEEMLSKHDAEQLAASDSGAPGLSRTA